MKKTCGNCKHSLIRRNRLKITGYYCQIKSMEIKHDNSNCGDWSDIRLCPFCNNMPWIETEFSFKSARMFKDGYVVKCNCGLKTKPFKTQKALKKYWNGETASV